MNNNSFWFIFSAPNLRIISTECVNTHCIKGTVGGHWSARKQEVLRCWPWCSAASWRDRRMFSSWARRRFRSTIDPKVKTLHARARHESWIMIENFPVFLTEALWCVTSTSATVTKHKTPHMITINEFHVCILWYFRDNVSEDFKMYPFVIPLFWLVHQPWMGRLNRF